MVATMPIKVRDGLPLVFILAMAAELSGVPSGDGGAASIARGSLTPLLNQALGSGTTEQSATQPQIVVPGSQVAQTCSNGAWRRC